jgi:hypothetical protein
MESQAHFALPYNVVERHIDRRAPESAFFSRVCVIPLRSLVSLTFSLSSFLGCVLEVAANKWWGLVLVRVLGGGLSLAGVSHDFLEGAHLLGSDLLHDLGHHVLEVLGRGLTLDGTESILEGVMDEGSVDVHDGVVLVEEVGLHDVSDRLGSC